MTAHETAFEPRVVCATCRRPETVCYCRFVTRIPTRTKVVILQHPRERDVPINTARIAALCLPEAELHVGVRFRGSGALARALADPLRPAALLYPGPSAVDVERAPPSGPITLVVIDGTWSQAKTLVRDNPELAALPRYAFRPPAPSEYRIRREPRDDYVSTIEALARVLGVLEGDPARFEAMLAPFRAMVDAQIAFAKRGESRHRRPLPGARRPPADPRARLPAELRERARDLVCVYGEANAWPHDSPERAARGDELVQWVACRIATGEVFEAVVAQDALAPATPRHTGIERDRFERGVSRAEMLAAWRAFLRPSDVPCAWGTYAGALAAAAGAPLAPLDLHRAARLYACASVGASADFVRRLGVQAPPVACTGRAAARLGELVAIARALAG